MISTVQSVETLSIMNPGRNESPVSPIIAQPACGVSARDNPRCLPGRVQPRRLTESDLDRVIHTVVLN